MKIQFLLIIGIVIFGTLAASVAGGIVTGYLYNKAWMANGNDIPKCMKVTYVENCIMDDDYLNGLDFWGKLVSFGVLISGLSIGIIICRKKISKKQK